VEPAEGGGARTGPGAGGAVSGGEGAMPGRIVMDQPGANGPPDLKKDRSQAQEGGLPGQVPQEPRGVKRSADGKPSHNALPNGVPAPATTNGEHATVAALAAGMSAPPPLDQTWRTQEHNKSLGTLMVRVAEQCYSDLNQTLAQMAEVPGDLGQANGTAINAGLEDKSSQSMKKKGLLLDFANTQRDRFTKTIVLSDWSRNSEEMARLIDLKVWQDKQRWATPMAAQAIAETKAKMVHFREPAPNIEGAMELLATGKIKSAPDFGLIPPKRLTAKQLLRTLKNMNVTLSTRLNLDEELPAHMNDFTIANGRATFRVPGEFEVDLSVADEAPSAPFYFIDIRFLFSPSSDLVSDIVRGHLEAGVNAQLATKGLQGCYDFLHNFVLSHKINVLRRQALAMIKNGRWFECIKVEHLRRNLIIQYWTGMPGPKNWIEIGITTGKQQKFTMRPPTAELSVRWFRRGVEMPQEPLDFDWTNLDMESCLMTIIGKHCFGKLTSAKAEIDALSPAASPLKTEVEVPKEAVEESRLKLSLPSMRTPLSVQIEPVTGQLTISPASPVTFSSQQLINNTPAPDLAAVLISLTCNIVRQKINDQAKLLGWTRVPVPSHDPKLPPKTQQLSAFLPPGWTEPWALMLTVGVPVEAWWICKLAEGPGDSRNAPSKVITELKAVDLSTGSKKQLHEVSINSLRQVERLAGAEVFTTVLGQELRAANVDYGVLKVPRRAEDGRTPLFGPSSMVCTTFSSLVRQNVQAPSAPAEPWAEQSIRLSYHGKYEKATASDESAPPSQLGANIRLELRLMLKPGKLNSLRKGVSNDPGKDIRIKDTGGLALRIITRFGAPMLEQIRRRLHNLEKLDAHLAILRKLLFKCTHVSQARLSFTYSETPKLQAELKFANDGSFPVRLTLGPRESNPHERIKVLLVKILNRKDVTNYFAIFAQSLALTLPLMETFQRLEDAHAARQTLRVHARSATNFELAYKTPLPACTFEVLTRSKERDLRLEVRWHLTDVTGKPEGPSEAFKEAMDKLWKTTDERWLPIGNGLISDARGIAPALEKLDEIVRSFESTSQDAAGAVSGSEGEKQADTGKAPAKNNEVIELD
jgi:mediator of RNA polymerase II transcription subunit 14